MLLAVKNMSEMHRVKKNLFPTNFYILHKVLHKAQAVKWREQLSLNFFLEFCSFKFLVQIVQEHQMHARTQRKENYHLSHQFFR